MGYYPYALIMSRGFLKIMTINVKLPLLLSKKDRFGTMPEGETPWNKI
jgi:hypothetical protein